MTAPGASSCRLWTGPGPTASPCSGWRRGTAGSITISRFLEAGLLTRLQVAIAPPLIGGGPQGLTLAAPSDLLADAIRPEMRVFSLGTDVVFDCGLTPGTSAATHPAHQPDQRRMSDTRLR